MAVQTIATLKANMPLQMAGGTSVQDIHDIVDTMEDRTSQAIFAKTGNYTAASVDNRRRFVFNTATDVTFTIPNFLSVGWECSVIQQGVGKIIFAVSNGTLRSKDGHTKTAGPYSMAYVTMFASSQILLTGDTEP